MTTNEIKIQKKLRHFKMCLAKRSRLDNQMLKLKRLRDAVSDNCLRLQFELLDMGWKP